MAMQESNQINHDQTPEPASNLGATLLRVAWLAIALGLLMEVILLVLGGALGEVFGLRPLVADLVRNITWSVFVCVGLAIGTAVVKARVPVMGLLGLLSIEMEEVLVRMREACGSSASRAARASFSGSTRSTTASMTASASLSAKTPCSRNARGRPGRRAAPSRGPRPRGRRLPP